MILLERPYVSDHFLTYLSTSRQPVLRTAFTEELAARQPLHLVDEDEAVRRCRDGERLYSSSENALDWIYQHLSGMPVVQYAGMMKDKAAMRALLADMSPEFTFQVLSARQLRSTDISGWKKPFVLKPATGFFSVGVYTITSDEDWSHTVDNIEQAMAYSGGQFPASVVDPERFIVESYITGTEYAVDVYYDAEGEPVVLNIFQHRFASVHDVSDRLYITGKAVIEENLPRFENFFRAVNRKMGVRNFPVHVELRVEGDCILPIEFNPLRFAGLCTTDIAWHAFGINTVDCYLHNRRPDFKSILSDHDDSTYAMIVLGKPDSQMASSRFDYARLSRQFHDVLELRRIDLAELPAFGFLFARTDAAHAAELDAILTADLTQYMQ